MLTGNNKLTREEFIGQIGHPRKEEMANMILDEASFEELEEKGFGRISVLEMAALISANIIDMQEFVVEVPEDDSVVSAKDENANGQGEGDAPEGQPGTQTANTVEDPEAGDVVHDSDTPETPDTPGDLGTPGTPGTPEGQPGTQPVEGNPLV